MDSQQEKSNQIYGNGEDVAPIHARFIAGKIKDTRSKDVISYLLDKLGELERTLEKERRLNLMRYEQFLKLAHAKGNGVGPTAIIDVPENCMRISVGEMAENVREYDMPCGQISSVDLINNIEED